MRPPYIRIADELRERITTGQILVGGALPSYNQICRDFYTTLATAKKAVDVLRDQGLVHTVRGIGTQVIADQPRVERDDTTAMITEVSRRLDTLEATVRKIETIIDQTLGSIRRSHSTDA